MSAVLKLLPWHAKPFQQLYQQLAAGRLGHAWLVAGPEGVGKDLFARYFAQRLFCREAQGSAPCGECKDCQYFAAGSHPDWRFVGPEKKLITIDLVRDSMDFVFSHSQRGGYKVLCLAPAEAMNGNAANALLKMLEEPPPMTLLLLLTHQSGLLLPTLRSRCQRLTIPLPEQEAALAWLQQQDCPHAEELLLRAAGAPLRALALAEAGYLSEYENVLALVCDILRGRSTALAAARKCGKPSVAGLVEHLMQDLVLLLKASQAGKALVGTSLQSLQSLIADSGQVRRSQRLLHALYINLDRIRMTALASNNANPQMLLEQVFAEWSKVARLTAAGGVDG